MENMESGSGTGTGMIDITKYDRLNVVPLKESCVEQLFQHIFKIVESILNHFQHILKCWSI